jgi:hypothetical protein
MLNFVTCTALLTSRDVETCREKEGVWIHDEWLLIMAMGGPSPGLCTGGVEEQKVNLFTGQELYHELHKYDEGQDIQVMLTRDADYDIPISVRYQLINEHHERKPIQLVISVHYNAVGDPSVSGFEVYYLAGFCEGARRGQGGFTGRSASGDSCARGGTDYDRPARSQIGYDPQNQTLSSLDRGGISDECAGSEECTRSTFPDECGPGSCTRNTAYLEKEG